MATIQIRDLPDDVHATYRARAAAAGKSLQQYLRDLLLDVAKTRSPGEIAAEVEEERRIRGDVGFSRMSTAVMLRADRDRR
jgi:plasmid stability protein